MHAPAPAMAKTTLQSLPGFRDFTPDRCLNRNYLFKVWRRVARRYGFVEYEAPVLEATELYLKKSGGELSSQLFRFTDQGDRDVTLRPELTASLARIAASEQRNHPKPIKWFEIGECFRYEKPQKGRLRSFYQFNADILGEPSAQADAELIALAIDTHREFGLDSNDFKVRLSDRNAWTQFADRWGISPEQLPKLLAIIDKIERDPPDVLEAKLKEFSLNRQSLLDFIADPRAASPALNAIVEDLTARGLGDYLEVDLSIVRGLAYYTGVVFEVFDCRRSLRAVAGGGRYDDLIAALSDGKVELPATGFAMGDVVISHLIEETTEANLRLGAWRQRQRPCEIYLVVLDEAQRAHALALAQQLRDLNIKIDLALTPTKPTKQFKAAEAQRARFALVIGDEFPKISLKVLAFRREETYHHSPELAAQLRARLDQDDAPQLA